MLSVLFPDDIRSQSSVGIGYGISVYGGDLGQPSIIDDFKMAGLAFNIHYKLQLTQSLKARLSLYTGQISGDDRVSSVAAQRSRNLRFQNNLAELSLGGEFDFSQKFLGHTPLSLYAIGAVSLYRSNPTTEYNGVRYELRELNTENQIISYALYHPSLQIGGGVEFSLNEAISINFELIARLSNNDFIDDVSGIYPNFNTTLQQQGRLSANLSDRRDEFAGLPEGTTDIPGIGDNNRRGNPSSTDYFITGVINVIVDLNTNGYGNKYGVSCPSLF